MKIIYFESIKNPDRIAFTVTDKTIKQLVADGVLKRGQKYVMKDYKGPEESDLESFLRNYHIHLMKFDNKANPKDIVIDSDLAAAEHIQILRDKRDLVLNTLDKLQLRFLSQGKQEVVAEIERDKEVLRQMPSQIKLGRVDSISKLYDSIPACLLVDYEDKYKGR